MLIPPPPHTFRLVCLAVTGLQNPGFNELVVWACNTLQKKPSFSPGQSQNPSLERMLCHGDKVLLKTDRLFMVVSVVAQDVLDTFPGSRR